MLHLFEKRRNCKKIHSDTYEIAKADHEKMFGNDSVKNLYARQNFFADWRNKNTHALTWALAAIMAEQLNKEISEKEAEGT